MFGLECDRLLAFVRGGMRRGRRTIEGPFGASPIPLFIVARDWGICQGGFVSGILSICWY